MKFRLAIRAAAREDIRGARDWYDDQAPGLGDKFGEALDGAMTLIYENPMMFPAIEGSARRALMRRFPYAIYSWSMAIECRYSASFTRLAVRDQFRRSCGSVDSSHRGNIKS